MTIKEAIYFDLKGKRFNFIIIRLLEYLNKALTNCDRKSKNRGQHKILVSEIGEKCRNPKATRNRSQN